MKHPRQPVNSPSRLGTRTKRAIFNQETVRKYVHAADAKLERPPIRLMLEHGLHPTQVGALETGNLTFNGDEWVLSYYRVKNARPVDVQLAPEEAEALRDWLAWKKRPRTRGAFFAMARRVGLQVGITNVSPLTLRHTAGLGWLREAQRLGIPSPIEWVAAKMACSVRVVTRNYIALTDWERINHKEAMTV